jgi:hypothetical protein
MIITDNNECALNVPYTKLQLNRRLLETSFASRFKQLVKLDADSGFTAPALL